MNTLEVLYVITDPPCNSVYAAIRLNTDNHYYCNAIELANFSSLCFGRILQVVGLFMPLEVQSL